ncbi:regulatory protein, Fis family [Nannocystis exedens]|uniref:Regulatory protein, Fis family n=1 Tax=Nannocystis exedens TaxID=54 RepID=A0A1I2H6F3_9BACT|nr:helix-turn-helix domain-containing protein [Nannocystis exedens]PCC74031.1 Bacterial regulatory protein, Fis family [Nannocystis exedens]SFF24356.1 regulatory protein, Fis family [Nannocystis exedens]
MQYTSIPHPPLQAAEVATRIIHEWATAGLLPGRARRADAAPSRHSPATAASQPIVLDSYNLEEAERRLCEQALATAGSLVHAAAALGITRHSLKRRIVKLGIVWPRDRSAS